MQAVSFMYVRPPGYNAESAKAAEIADERKKEEQSQPPQDPNANGATSSKYVSLCIVLIFLFLGGLKIVLIYC